MNQVTVFNKQTKSFTISVGDVYTTKTGKQFEVRAVVTAQFVGHNYVEDSIKMSAVGTEAGIITNQYTKRQFAARFLAA